MRINRQKEHREHLFDFKKAKRRNSILIAAVSLMVIFLVFNQARKERRELVRFKVEETVRDLVEITSALERYEVDHDGPALNQPGIYSMEKLWFLTTPHAYLWDWEELSDPFVQQPYRVGVLDSSPALLFLLGSGPNGEWDLQRPPARDNANRDTLHNLLAAFTYDPTNGLLSGGDIVHPVGQWTDFNFSTEME
jgi:hypothetical protein